MKKMFLAIGLCAIVAGCKKVEYRDRQETLDELERLRKDNGEKTDFIKDLRTKLAEAEMGTTGVPAPPLEGEAWVFVIEGDLLVIKARPAGVGGGGGPPIDDKAATAMGEQFVDLVKKSRGSIQKCYEQALKKSSVPARTVNLTLSVSFAASGAFNRISFDYDLDKTFDSCLRGVASKWKLPAASASRTFQTTVKLTPT